MSGPDSRMTGRERVTALLSGGEPDRLPFMPITMMRAAEHIGVKYRDYVTDHRVLAEAQIRIAERFDIDHVSVISDPAREVSDLGGAVQWFEDQPPAVIEERALLADKQRLTALRLPDISSCPRMRDRVEGVRLLRRRVGRERMIEGWVEGPCAMSADLRGVNRLMLDFFDDPGFVRELFDFSVAMELETARAQIEAGADIVGVGDAAASLVGPKLYHEFVLPGEVRLVQAIRQLGARVRLHICGKTRKLFQGMVQTGAEIIDLDFLAPLDEARAAMGPVQVLLGNVDPVRVMRDGSPEDVSAAFAEGHRQAGSRYIVGAGCEIPRGTPDANLLAAAQYARSHCAVS
ncbi:MAG TPA: uroporphyrinogen decarboxylase family protein [Candidatus Sulfopaludibacter sp.]|nr:uroporphyrinogen decarboxylase family protein [Candidatus Sulfopaludibacter sp.]